MGTRSNHFGAVVLTSTHNPCFGLKIRNKYVFWIKIRNKYVYPLEPQYMKLGYKEVCFSWIYDFDVYWVRVRVRVATQFHFVLQKSNGLDEANIHISHFDIITSMLCAYSCRRLQRNCS